MILLFFIVMIMVFLVFGFCVRGTKRKALKSEIERIKKEKAKVQERLEELKETFRSLLKS